jgi:hypothetical protein
MALLQQQVIQAITEQRIMMGMILNLAQPGAVVTIPATHDQYFNASGATGISVNNESVQFSGNWVDQPVFAGPKHDRQQHTRDDHSKTYGSG